MSQVNQQRQTCITIDPYRSDGQGWVYAITYSGSDVTDITRTNEAGLSQKKTFTYTGSNVTAITAWITQ